MASTTKKTAPAEPETPTTELAAPDADEPTPTIVQALSRVMRDTRAVAKDSQANMGRGGSFNFRGVDAVVNAVAPTLRAHGVVVMPRVLNVERATVPRSGGGAMLSVYVTTEFTFHGPAGDSISCVVLGEAADTGDKATSKAQSVALRVALLQALMLPTDDPDPDESHYERADPRQAAQSAPRGRQEGREERAPDPEPPSHVQQFWEAFGLLDGEGQAWVKANWPDGFPQHPNRLTVAQVSEALKVVAAVPPR